ncbi:MAG: DNA primase [Treponema sp.]|nr:DNA primase [Treponema sp.]
MYISKATIQEVMQRMDAVTVVEEYLRLEKRGGRFWGRCPFHAGGQERTASFTVDPDKKLYYCFGCQKGGGIIDFVMEMDKSSYPETLRNLAKKFSVAVVYENGALPESAEDESEKTRKEQLYELYRRTAVTFQHFLLERPEGKAALDYLLSRKISREMIERFQLGFSTPDAKWLHHFLQTKGYSADFLAGSGLFSQHSQETAFFVNRLMFPIADRHGRIVAFGGRAMPQDGIEDKKLPKYINTREIDTYSKGQILYGLDLALQEIRRQKTVYIAEGYMDVIALHQAGICNAAAPCGTALTEEQAKMLRRWADTAVLVFDSDEAGQNAAAKSIILCRKTGLNCRLIDPETAANEPKLKDPADILKEFDAETLKNFMNHVILDIEYLLNRGIARFGSASPFGKNQICGFLFPYIDVLGSDSERDDCFSLTADRIHLNKASIVSDFVRWQHSSRQSPAEPAYMEAPQKKTLIQMNDELFLLIVVLVNPYLYPEFRKMLSMHEIDDINAKEIFVALEECFTNDQNSVEIIISRINSVDLRNFIIKRGISPEFKGDSNRNPEKLMEDGIKRIKIKKLRKRREEIISEIRVKERNSVADNNDLTEFFSEQRYIDNEIQILKGK